EPPDYELETLLRLLWRQLGHRRLLADDERELRDQVDHQSPVRLQRLEERVAPAGQVRLALAEERLDQLVKGLSDRGVRDVAPVLVELSRGKQKQAARRHEHRVQLVDHRSFPNARIPRPHHPAPPLVTTRAKAPSRVSISRARPYSFSGMTSRSGMSCSASGNASIRPSASHRARQRRRSRSTPAAVW